MYVYVNEWHQMIYHPFMFNGFKSGSHRENNKFPLLLCLNKLSLWFLKYIVLGDFGYWFKLYFSGLGTRLPALFAIFRTSTLCMLVKIWSHNKHERDNKAFTSSSWVKTKHKTSINFECLKVAHKKFTLEWLWNTSYM
jgi:hypothetical protein